MATGYDIWGVIAGVLGIVSLFPLLYGVLKSQLPSSKLKILDETLSETSSLFREVCEEGLLKNRDYINQTEYSLTLYVATLVSVASTDTMARMRNQTEDLRLAAHSAHTLLQETIEWSRGLSRKIVILCEEVKLVRASVYVDTPLCILLAMLIYPAR